MASIKQIIAEIQLAPDLPPSHKQKAVQIIRDAEERLKIKGVNSKPRKITNAKSLVTLEEWENARGKELHFTDFEEWITKKKLHEFQVRLMIEEFREEMTAKGKQYANFKAAFQTYLTKGYLSKPITACLLENNKSDVGTIIHSRGVSL